MTYRLLVESGQMKCWYALRLSALGEIWAAVVVIPVQGEGEVQQPAPIRVTSNSDVTTSSIVYFFTGCWQQKPPF